MEFTLILLNASFILALVFAVLQFLDVKTTNQVLANGGKELNPIMKKFQDRLGKYWWLPKALFALGVVALVFYYPNWMFGAGLVVVDLFYLKVVMQNRKVIKNQK